MTSVSIPSDIASSIGDRYRIERELGRGGMATVYLADDLKHGRQVAIKFMHPELAEAIGLDRFLREIEIAARLSHPHIVPLFDSGAAGDRLYYVMPFVAGESLRARLQRERQLPVEDSLRLAREIASALGHAHAKGLVHRDVKPENVLLADDIALVADFGIARAQGIARGTAGDTQAATMAGPTRGMILGTPVYMAPEQAREGGEVDGRADQYALGCVLYEMLAGTPPFTGPSVTVVRERHANDTLPPLRQHRLGLPEGLERVLARALAKSPADRYPSMGSFAEALAGAATAASTPTPRPDAREPSHPNNLPRQRTSFVGRERELAECARLLGEVRLLTLTGVGGCGKTRLALRLAETMLGGMSDGVWFVDLAPLHDGARVAQAVAAALDVREDSGDLLASLSRFVADRRMLLVLDNCEHVLRDTAALADLLLAAGHEVSILATSREGLGVEGERLFAVSALGVPGAPAATDLREIEASPAVRLFVERARLVRGDFVLDAANAAGVAEICRRLDGVPLALELAAARVRVLSVDEIRSRLDDRFRLLTGGNRALPRQQTLHATIQWSFDQLTEEEKNLFAVLSVFIAGWTLESASSVAELDEFETLETLSRLVDKSLVAVDRLEDGTSRYRMLETFRQFAQEKLDESGLAMPARGRHLDYFLDWVRESWHLARGATETAWIRLIARDHENLLAALAFDPPGRSAERTLQLAGYVSRFWYLSGLGVMSADLTRQLLERDKLGAPTPGRGVGLLARCTALWSCGRSEEARPVGEEALAVLKRYPESHFLPTAYNVIANVHSELGDLARARALYEAGLEAALALDAVEISIRIRNNLAELTRQVGDYAAARALTLEVVEDGRRTKDLDIIASSLANLSAIELLVHNVGAALGHALEAAKLLRGAGLTRQSINQLEQVAGIAAESGDLSAAVRFYAMVGELRREYGVAREGADARLHDPLIARVRAELGEPEFGRFSKVGSPRVEGASAEALAWLENAQSKTR